MNWPRGVAYAEPEIGTAGKQTLNSRALGNRLTIPARAIIENTTVGPDKLTSRRPVESTKIPVPMIAPIPVVRRAPALRGFFRALRPTSASAMIPSIGFIAKVTLVPSHQL